MSRFFIRSDYIFNDLNGNTTYDRDGEIYWTPERIRASEIFQYPVYQFVASCVRKSKIRSPLVGDVGCGAAYKGLKLLASITENYCGLDQPNVIQILRDRYPRVNWVEADFENDALPLAGSFDFIVCSDVIEHLVRPDLFLDKLKTLLKPDGILFLSTPDRFLLRGPKAIKSPNLKHIQEWSADEFDRFISSAGLLIEQRIYLPPMRLRLHSLGAYFRHRFTQLLSPKLAWKYNYLLVLKMPSN